MSDACRLWAASRGGIPDCDGKTSEVIVWLMEIRKNEGKHAVHQIKIGIAMALLTTLVGCVGYVGGGGGYDGGVIVPVPGPPDVVLFGGGFERGRDVHEYSRRGGESRERAHSVRGDRGKRR